MHVVVAHQKAQGCNHQDANPGAKVSTIDCQAELKEHRNGQGMSGSPDGVRLDFEQPQDGLLKCD